MKNATKSAIATILIFSLIIMACTGTKKTEAPDSAEVTTVVEEVEATVDVEATVNVEATEEEQTDGAVETETVVDESEQVVELAEAN